MIELSRSDVYTLLPHMAHYGLGAILDDAGVTDLRLQWTGGPQPVPQIIAADLTGLQVDELVRRHAAAHYETSSWVRQNLSGTSRGLMSPRLSAIGDDSAWARLQTDRHQVLDELLTQRAFAELRYLNALGEPCYWSHNTKGERQQDDGANRLEMQPRNQGSEFVGSRLRKVAAAVAARPPGAVLAGLIGDHIIDEAGNGKSDSRTPTGFAPPGPTDNALAWCALWGLGQFPLAARINATAKTSGHHGRSRTEWFYVPVWTAPWTTARLRTVLASQALHVAAAAGLDTPRPVEPSRIAAARARVAAFGVEGIIRFPVRRFGSDSAPERRAMRGEPLSVARP